MKKYLEVGKRLRELRKDLSQEEFAKRLGISPRGYQKYEAGERVPHPHTLTNIAEMCDTTTDWILTGELNIEKARLIERLKTAGFLEELVEKLEERNRREEKLLFLEVKEKAPQYGLERVKDKELIENLKSYIAEVKVDFASPEARELIYAMMEIFKTGYRDIIDALSGNIKVFLNASRARKERRSYPRSLLTVPVNFEITDGAKNHSGKILNAGQMGLLIQTTHDMPLGKEISLEVSVRKDTGPESFRTKGQIIWKKGWPQKDAEEYHYGVKLIEISDDGQVKLESLIRGYHKEHRRGE